MSLESPTFVEPDSTTPSFDLASYLELIEDFPNDLSRWISKFRESDS